MRAYHLAIGLGAIGGLAGRDLRHATFEKLAGVPKREVCYQENPTCVSCFGAGSVLCNSDNSCFNPGLGESCCANGHYCQSGYYCALDSYGSTVCCDNGESLADCGAVSTGSTLAPPPTSTTAPSYTSSTAPPSSAAYTTATSASTVAGYAYPSSATNYTAYYTASATYTPAQQTTNAGSKSGDKALLYALGGLSILLWWT